jgi:hypothetical protein
VAKRGTIFLMTGWFFLAAGTAWASCAGSLCVDSSPAGNLHYYSPPALPPVDMGGRDWTSASYVPGAGWSVPPTVTSAPAGWVASCGTSGPGAGPWISAVPGAWPSPDDADWYVRRTFTLPAGASVTAATLAVSADNSVDVFVNGSAVTTLWRTDPVFSDLYAVCTVLPLDPALFAEGPNALAIIVNNSMTYMGLAYELCLEYGCRPTPSPTPTMAFNRGNGIEFIPDRNVFGARGKDPIRFWVRCPYQGGFRLILYNSAGERIRTLEDTVLEAPLARFFEWDGRNEKGDPVADGVYIAYAAFPVEVAKARFVVAKGSRRR